MKEICSTVGVGCLLDILGIDLGLGRVRDGRESIGREKDGGRTGRFRAVIDHCHVYDAAPARLVAAAQAPETVPSSTSSSIVP